MSVALSRTQTCVCHRDKFLSQKQVSVTETRTLWDDKIHIIYYQIPNLGQSSVKDKVIKILLNALIFHKISLKINCPAFLKNVTPNNC